MRQIELDALEDGMSFGEDLFAFKSRVGGPLFSRGLNLNPKNIARIQNLLADRGHVLVDAGSAGGEPPIVAVAPESPPPSQPSAAEEEGPPVGVEAILTASNLSQEDFSKADVAQLIRAEFGDREDFQWAQEKLTNYFSHASDILQNISDG